MVDTQKKMMNVFDINKPEDRKALIMSKEQQIKEILGSEDITYGMAKTIIQRVEADLLKSGDTFLNLSKLKNVSPFNPLWGRQANNEEKGGERRNEK